jgi:hypothetical protein
VRPAAVVLHVLVTQHAVECRFRDHVLPVGEPRNDLARRAVAETDAGRDRDDLAALDLRELVHRDGVRSVAGGRRRRRGPERRKRECVLARRSGCLRVRRAWR